MRTVIHNIGRLCGILPASVRRLEGEGMSQVECIGNAWLEITDGIISGYGGVSTEGDLAVGPGSAPGGRGSRPEPDADEVIDAEGGYVMPTFCDSHTHIVYAGSRDGEFRDKIAGLSYEEIAARGGGILNSADLLHNTSEDELFRQSLARVHEIMAKGTGAVEIKSGYGLRTEDELKMLRVIKRIRETVPITVKATFLGAHAVGREYAGNRGAYVDLVCSEMLPRVAEEGLADYVDVFCDKGFFTPEDTSRILEAAAAFGLRGKIHANELAISGGVQVGVQHGALSVDHLERTGQEEIECLRGRETMPTMLPGASFFLGMPYGRAKDFINAGLPFKKYGYRDFILRFGGKQMSSRRWFKVRWKWLNRLLIRLYL